MLRHHQRTLILTMALCVAATAARAQTDTRVVTDKIAYNAGEPVKVRLVEAPVSSGTATRASRALFTSIWYEGDKRPVIENLVLPVGAKPSSGYVQIWSVPLDAPTGRYAIRLEERGAAAHRAVSEVSLAASFGIYRQLVSIELIRLAKTVFTSGDSVGVEATIKNLTSQPLDGLRVEFSDRYWPWIAGPAEQARASIVPLAESVSLAAEDSKTFRAAKVAVAPDVEQPSTHQYGVVVWNGERTQVLAIAFSPLAFINPPGVDAPRPYPGQYMYPDLAAIDGFNYRHFYPPELESPAIVFDHEHTMWTPGSTATVKFRLTNPTHSNWSDVLVTAHLVSPAGSELATDATDKQLSLPSDGPPLERSASFAIPARGTGVYRLLVDVREPGGRILAANSLELGVNPLPKSLLIFCAHEDDEGGFDGLTRAAIENHVPVHIVYFTSGDAGSCDRYYEHSCSPAEALNFGAVRMQEGVASLGHLGVPADDVSFFGLPDGGSGMIWFDHTKPNDPFLDPLLAVDHSPYENIFGTNLSYDRRSVVDAVKEVIKKYQPELICTPHPPSVGHIDHIVDNYFVVKALQELANENGVPPDLKLFDSRAYDPIAQPHTPYQYEPVTFFVSGDVAALSQEARWFHQSQGGTFGEGRLRSFAQLPRSEGFREVLDWKQHEGWNDKR